MAITPTDLVTTLDVVSAAMQRLHAGSGPFVTHAGLEERLRLSPLAVEQRLDELEEAARVVSAGLRDLLSVWVTEQIAAEVRTLRARLEKAEDELLRAELTDVAGQPLPFVDHDERRAQRDHAERLLDGARRAVAACDEAVSPLVTQEY